MGHHGTQDQNPQDSKRRRSRDAGALQQDHLNDDSPQSEASEGRSEVLATRGVVEVVYPVYVVNYGRGDKWRKVVTVRGGGREIIGNKWLTKVFKLMQRDDEVWVYMLWKRVEDEVCGKEEGPSQAVIKRAKQYAEDHGMTYHPGAKHKSLADILFPAPIPTIYERLLGD